MNEFEQMIIDLVDSNYKLSHKEHEKILKLYKQSRDNINAFISALYSEYGDNGKLDLSVLRRYNALEELDLKIQEELRGLSTQEASILAGILGTVYAATYYKSAYSMEKHLEMKVNFNLLRPEMINQVVNFDWSGVPFSERIWDNQNALRKSIKSELTRGIQEGKTIDEMSRVIKKQFGSKAYQSQRLMRTESARVIDEATRQIYKDSGVVKQVEWVATLEENTCDECRSLDGQRFQLDNGTKPTIPRHPNCRCVYIGVPYEGYNPEKRKDNETKEVIDYKNYEEWYQEKINQ